MLLPADVRAREATRASRVVPLGTCDEGAMNIGGDSTCAQTALSIPSIANPLYRVLELPSYASMLSISLSKNCVCISTVQYGKLEIRKIQSISNIV